MNSRTFFQLLGATIILIIAFWAVYTVRQYLPLLGDILLGVIALSAVISVPLGVMWYVLHFQEKRRIANTIHVQEHGTYVFHEGTYVPLLPATVHVAAYNAPVRPVTQIVEADEPKLLSAPSQEQGNLALPGRCDFADHLGFWRPTPDEILIGLGPGGQRLTVPLKSLCHVALAGATGGGKSVIMRLLLSQILYVNARVALADPHFAPVDPESGEDWRPIVSRLAVPPCVSYDSIRAMLRWMAEQELPKRLEKRRQGIHPGDPFFLAIDELPAIVARVPEAPDYMGAILREGRKVGLFLVSAAQDWLVKTVGGSGGVRDCFRTAFYVGGDATSARVLLDVKGSVDDGSLGKGIVMLRSTATPKASLSRVPYASNDALVTLLGSPRPRMENLQPKPPLQNAPSSPRSHLHLVEVDTEGEHEAVSEGASQGNVVDSTPIALSELEKKIGEMFFSEGKNPNEIARLLWPDVKGGDAYRKNAALVADTIRKVASTKKVGA